MKTGKNFRYILGTVIVASVSLATGYAIGKTSAVKMHSSKVTGIGGIFFKCKDPKAVRAWYQSHLGIKSNQYGSVFQWYHGADSTQKGFTQWSPFKETTTYFLPSQKEFMINYRVADLEALVKDLKAEGVQVTDTIESFDYGKFVHIMDLEGNKIELWEPVDKVYATMGDESSMTY